MPLRGHITILMLAGCFCRKNLYVHDVIDTDGDVWLERDSFWGWPSEQSSAWPVEQRKEDPRELSKYTVHARRSVEYEKLMQSYLR